MEGNKREHYFDSELTFDRLLARMFNASVLHTMSKRILQKISNLYQPLRRKENEYLHLPPRYLLDSKTLESCLISYKNINFIGHGLLLWIGF